MVQEHATLLFTTLYCVHEAKDAATHDQPYLKYRVDGGSWIRYPDTYWAMNTGDGESINVEIDVTYKSKIEVQLWEGDPGASSDDLMGYTMTIDRNTSRNAQNEGQVRFNKSGEPYDYILYFRVLTDPIPTVRVHGIRCEQDSAGMNVDLVETIAGAAQTCMDAAATVLHHSPRPRAQLMAEAFEEASKVLMAKVKFKEWKESLKEGRDDIYMKHVVQTRGMDGAFFPVGDGVEHMGKNDEVYFEDRYGEYFLFPLDTGPVTIEIKEHDPTALQYDCIVGSLIIDPEQIAKNSSEGIDGGSPETDEDVPPITGGMAVFNGDAVVEIANSYYGRHNGEGAVYHLCYSVGMEDWCKPATAAAQQSGNAVPGTYYHIVAKHSGKCLEVAGASQSNGANIQQYQIAEVSNHMFCFKEVEEDYGTLNLYEDSNYTGDRRLYLELNDFEEHVFYSFDENHLDYMDCMSSVEWSLGTGVTARLYEDLDAAGKTYTMTATGKRSWERGDSFNDVASGFMWWKSGGTRSASESNGQSRTANPALVNLNTASAKELDGLPGIGEKLAERIVTARQERPFIALEDVERVHGIGPGKRQKLEELVTC